MTRPLICYATVVTLWLGVGRSGIRVLNLSFKSSEKTKFRSWTLNLRLERIMSHPFIQIKHHDSKQKVDVWKCYIRSYHWHLWKAMSSRTNFVSRFRRLMQVCLWCSDKGTLEDSWLYVREACEWICRWRQQEFPQLGERTEGHCYYSAEFLSRAIFFLLQVSLPDTVIESQQVTLVVITIIHHDVFTVDIFIYIFDRHCPTPVCLSIRGCPELSCLNVQYQNLSESTWKANNKLTNESLLSLVYDVVVCCCCLFAVSWHSHHSLVWVGWPIRVRFR